MARNKYYKRRRRNTNRTRTILGILFLLILTVLMLQAFGVFDIFASISAGNFKDDPSKTEKTTASSSTSDSSVAASDTGIQNTQPATSPSKPAGDPISLSDLPGYVPVKTSSTGSFYKVFKDGGRIDWWIFQNSTTPLQRYKPTSTIVFPPSQDFTKIEGVLTFRGNNYRDAPNWGTADVSQKKLEIVWTHDIGAISGDNSYWPGAGWTGQPLLVHWPESTRQVMGINDEFKSKDLVEVIYPVFDGNIYFLDLATGKPTRDPIKVGFGFKGTGSVDPRGYPLFYAGQGLNDTNGKIGPFKYRIFDLIHNKEIYGIPGSDPVAFRKWGAFDPSTIIDRQTDTMIEPGENGIIYKTKLNTIYDPDAKTITINPQITKFRYQVSYQKFYGVENSPVMYRNLLYFSDNGGAVVCMDINTLEPLWIANTHDDSDATIVLEETQDGVFLYHGNEIDHRGNSATGAGANCNIQKFNALTGELIWQYDVPCVYDSIINGGMLATPLIGKDDISDLIIFNIAKTKDKQTGLLIGMDKKTGKPVWTRDLDYYSWSSPISIKGTDGKSYGIFCDNQGEMHLFDPRTGKDLDKISLGKNVEASPSAYNNMIVVASYAQKIFGIKIK